MTILRHSYGNTHRQQAFTWNNVDSAYGITRRQWVQVLTIFKEFRWLLCASLLVSPGMSLHLFFSNVCWLSYCVTVLGLVITYGYWYFQGLTKDYNIMLSELGSPDLKVSWNFYADVNFNLAGGILSLTWWSGASDNFVRVGWCKKIAVCC